MNFQEQVAGFLSIKPKIHASAYVAPPTYIVGDVEIREQASIWPFASLRGDIAPIHIGAYSNIQDNAVLHVGDHFPTWIGEWVTVGHGAIVHGCEIADEVLIGMGSIILDGAHIGTRCLIGAGSVVTQGTVIPPGSLVYGSPARIQRALTVEEQAELRIWAKRYVDLSREYLRRAS